MLENIDKTITSLCERIQKDSKEHVCSENLAEVTKALAELLTARAFASGNINL